MKSDLPPSFRISTLPQGQSKLIELSVPQPAIEAVAIVLDLSDSCAPMTEDLRRLPKLLALRPRRTPVWVYHMSGTRPLVKEQLTVGHLVDKTMDPERWLNDRGLLSELKLRGTLLRPAIESIRARCAVDDVARVTVLVLTDGEILDADAIDVSQMNIVGLITEQDQEKSKHWRRVLGDAPLCRLGDAALDAAIRGDATSFYGLCTIEINPSSPVVAAFRFDRARGALIPLRGNTVEWNFTDGPLHVGATCPAGEIGAISVSCTSVRLRTKAIFSSTATAEEVPYAVLDAFTTAVTRQPSDSTSILIDLGLGQKNFDEIWREAARAADMADRRERWVDATGRLVVFAKVAGADPGRIAPEALLCLCTADPRSAPSTNARVILVGVRKSPRPAIAWTKDRHPDFIGASTDIVLDYDPLESRWMLACGDEVRELNPRGSQRLKLAAGPPPSGNWFALFSGSIT